MYSLEGFFKLLGISLNNYLYLVPPGPELGQVNIIKGGRLIELNGVNSRG